jgi:hypothetical protein
LIDWIPDTKLLESEKGSSNNKKKPPRARAFLLMFGSKGDCQASHQVKAWRVVYISAPLLGAALVWPEKQKS